MQSHNHARPWDKPLAIFLALVIHVGLFLALTVVFHWKSEPVNVYAELWAPVELPSPQPVVAPETKPEPKPEPAPETKPEPEEEPVVNKQDAAPKISEEELAAIEEARRLEEQRQEEIRLAEERKKQEEAERARQEAQRLAELKRKQEEEARKKAEEARRQEQLRKERERQERIRKERERQERERQEQARIAAEIRQQELARITGARPQTTPTVGKPTANPNSTQNNPNGVMSEQFKERVIACIRPAIHYQVPPGLQKGEHVAIYQLELFPDGSHRNVPKQVQSSGLPQYDSAVQAAISQCNPIPRSPDMTTMPRVLELIFDPVEINNTVTVVQ